jgi:hypothetical protein
MREQEGRRWNICELWKNRMRENILEKGGRR